jgi:hypothetical protein
VDEAVHTMLDEWSVYVEEQMKVQNQAKIQLMEDAKGQYQ